VQAHAVDHTPIVTAPDVIADLIREVVRSVT
jgi:hypothetical protein